MRETKRGGQREREREIEIERERDEGENNEGRDHGLRNNTHR